MSHIAHTPYRARHGPDRGTDRQTDRHQTDALRLAQSCTWVGLTYALDRDGLDWVGLGRDFSVFVGLGWVGPLGPLTQRY